ncbi:GTP cyclohydrolase I FolE2 [Alteromonadaceae bacterium M269]|nr:GTP cyclohydrolase I FolE2 [Alteromonadaceae bacterium M269]
MYQTTSTLPDVSKQPHSTAASPLKWVGMEKIGLPIHLTLSSGLDVATCANVDIFVSLDTTAKGIHMSRLYLKLNEMLANQSLTSARLNKLLASILESHKDLSESAMIKLAFDLPLEKKALLSDNLGHQVYSVSFTQQINAGANKTILELTIPYSSTCPCSASLANQLNADAIDEKFSGTKVDKQELVDWLMSGRAALATPHNQRSYAYIKLELSGDCWGSIDALIFQFEQAIGTPVQTAVKREDEQEFARLNGNNLMFCEDAARRLKQFLESLDFVPDYWFKIEHQESLHAHNAVVIDQK